MRFLTIAATAAVVCATAATAATTAFAEPARLNDAQYIAANRCLGLMSSKTQGTPDAAKLAAYLDNQSGGRQGAVWDMADQARDDGRSAAARGGTEVVAERDSACHGFVAAAAAETTAAAAHPAHSL